MYMSYALESLYRIGFSLTGGDREEHDILDAAEAATMIVKLIPNTGG